MNEDQKAACDYVLSNPDKNLLILGVTRTGKSHVLRRIQLQAASRGIQCVTLAPTGETAHSIEGRTVHSFLSIPPNAADAAEVIGRLRRDSKRTTLLIKLQMIILDHVSQLAASVFELIHNVLVSIRACNKPFGGVQVIFAGDFFRIASSRAEFLFTKRLFQDMFCEASGRIVTFERSYGVDDEFSRNIAQLATGQVRNLDYFNVNLTATIPASWLIYLSPGKNIADKINDSCFNVLPEPSVTFELVSGSFSPSSFKRNNVSVGRTSSSFSALKSEMAVSNIEQFKIGSQVMIVTNKFSKIAPIFSGSIGIIKEFVRASSFSDYSIADNSSELISQPNHSAFNSTENIKRGYVFPRDSVLPLVEFRIHDVVHARVIPWVCWTRAETESLTNFAWQIPLTRANAISLFRAQSKSFFGPVVVKFTPSPFHGAAYTLLSRIQRSTDLFFDGNQPLAEKHVYVNPFVTCFYSIASSGHLDNLSSKLSTVIFSANGDAANVPQAQAQTWTCDSCDILNDSSDLVCRLCEEPLSP